MKAISAVLTSLLLSLTVAGCSLSPDRSPPPALHDFGPAMAGAEHPTWTVTSVDAPELLRDERIRYRLLYADPTRVRFYTRNRWLAPPLTLLQQSLVAAGGGSAYRLRIRLLEFEQVFDAPGQSRVVLRFTASAEGGKESATGEREFRFVRNTATADAAGAVDAYAAVTGEAVAAVRAWLSELSPIAAHGDDDPSR